MAFSGFQNVDFFFYFCRRIHSNGVHMPFQLVFGPDFDAEVCAQMFITISLKRNYDILVLFFFIENDPK
jgi:hypothetical protein